MDQADYAITEAMLRYGGSFIAALATAYRCADRENQRILKQAFEHVWMEYALFVPKQ